MNRQSRGDSKNVFGLFSNDYKDKLLSYRRETALQGAL